MTAPRLDLDAIERWIKNSRSLSKSNALALVARARRADELTAWIMDVATCRCAADWTDRGLHMTECLFDDAPDGITPPIGPAKRSTP